MAFRSVALNPANTPTCASCVSASSSCGCVRNRSSSARWMPRSTSGTILASPIDDKTPKFSSRSIAIVFPGAASSNSMVRCVRVAFSSSKSLAPVLSISVRRRKSRITQEVSRRSSVSISLSIFSPVPKNSAPCSSITRRASPDKRAAHSKHEQHDRDRHAYEHRRDDIDGDGKHGNRHHDRKIESDVEAVSVGPARQCSHQPQAPDIEMLNGDDHDHGREGHTRNLAKHGEKKGARYQKRHSVDQHRERCTGAKRPVSNAGADIDAAGNAADAGGGEIADSKPHEKPIAVAARLAERRYELGAQQRIDRGDDGERQRAAEDRRQKRDEITAARETSKIGKRRRTDRRARPARDDRAEIAPEPGKLSKIIENAAQADADEYRWNLGHQLFRIPHRGESDRRDRQTKRLDRVEMLRHLRERDRTVKTADVAKLDEKQQRGRGILEAGHDRLGAEFVQRPSLDDAEQRLEGAREQDNRKRNRKHERSAAGADRRVVRMCEAED